MKSDKNTIPLKPCPFCGKPPKVGDNGGAGGEFWHQIHCAGNGCEIEPYAQAFANFDLAAADWNRRPIEDADRTMISELIEALERLVEVGCCAGEGVIEAEAAILRARRRNGSAN